MGGQAGVFAVVYEIGFQITDYTVPPGGLVRERNSNEQA